MSTGTFTAYVREMDPSTENETLSTEWRSPWMKLTDLSRNAIIRRMNANYESFDDITLNIYTDLDDVNAQFTGTLKANNGFSQYTIIGDMVTNGAHDNSTTTLFTNGTDILTVGDLIQVYNTDEVMKVTVVGSGAHTVERGYSGTTPESFGDSMSLYYVRSTPSASIRIGKRARSMMFKLTSPASTNNIEIRHMEIEYE